MSETFSVFLHKGSKWVEEIHNLGLLPKHNKNIMEAFKSIGQLIVEDLAKVVYTGTKSGRVYIFRGSAHQASAPGESPANRSGRLMNSNHHTENVKRLQIYNDAVSDKGAPYGYYLEKGTKNMKPRPWFVSTIEKRSEDLRNALYKLGKKEE